MNEKDIHTRITADTRKKLKLLSALMEKSMIDVIAQLVDEALEKFQHEASQGVQISGLSNRKTEK